MRDWQSCSGRVGLNAFLQEFIDAIHPADDERSFERVRRSGSAFGGLPTFVSLTMNLP
jgi:hypothetical protein